MFLLKPLQEEAWFYATTGSLGRLPIKLKAY
jgi:hypothetical protein